MIREREYRSGRSCSFRWFAAIEPYTVTRQQSIILRLCSCSCCPYCDMTPSIISGAVAGTWHQTLVGGPFEPFSLPKLIFPSPTVHCSKTIRYTDWIQLRNFISAPTWIRNHCWTVELLKRRKYNDNIIDISNNDDIKDNNDIMIISKILSFLDK